MTMSAVPKHSLVNITEYLVYTCFSYNTLLDLIPVARSSIMGRDLCISFISRHVISATFEDLRAVARILQTKSNTQMTDLDVIRAIFPNLQSLNLRAANKESLLFPERTIMSLFSRMNKEKFCPHSLDLSYTLPFNTIVNCIFPLLRSEKIVKLKLYVRFGTYTNEHIEKIVSNFPNLVQLDLGTHQNVTDFALGKLLKNCNKLQNLTIEGFYNITDQTAIELSKLADLEKLNVSHCSSLTPRGIQKIVEKSKIPEQSDALETMLEGLLKPKRSLVCLQMIDIRGNCDELLSAIGLHSRSLNLLNISYCTFSDEGLVQLTSCVALRCLYVDENKGISMGGVRPVIETCNDLQYFSRKGCDKLKPDHLSVLRGINKRLQIA